MQAQRTAAYAATKAHLRTELPGETRQLLLIDDTMHLRCAPEAVLLAGCTCCCSSANTISACLSMQGHHAGADENHACLFTLQCWLMQEHAPHLLAASS